MLHKTIRHAAGLLAFCLAACQNTPSEAEQAAAAQLAQLRDSTAFVVYPDSLIDTQARACEHFGVIQKNTAEAELAAKYGRENVRTYRDSIRPDLINTSTTLFEGQPNQLLIVWHNADLLQYPQVCQFSNPQATWRTAEGVHVGMSLAELEQLNGKPFRIAGFGERTAGEVRSWEGGKLASSEKCYTIVLDYNRRRTLPVAFNQPFVSNAAGIDSLDIQVSLVRAYLNK